jgi:teichuronic acid biosynthesis glycosyltransferase TuaH
MKVIICEYHPWDTDFRIGNHHYAREFMNAGWDVMWISHPVSIIHRLKSENQRRIDKAACGPFKHENGPVEFVPYANLPFLNAPLLSSTWVLENSHRYFHPSFKYSLMKSGFDQPDLVWITDTVMHSVIDVAEPKAIAVRIADDNTEFKNIPASLREIESRLIHRSHVTFVTSSPLEEKLKSKYGTKINLLRNGVACEHFQGEYERPKGYENMRGPIAIYVGAIEEWFNVDWVEKLAKERKDINIVLIGKATIDISVLKNLDNVWDFGLVPYEEIPAYLAHADCGIIPFKRTKLVESVSPLKLFEFLAAGIPVVSTRWRELERLDSPAILAADGSEFVRWVSRMIDESWKEQRSSQFRGYARENSWNKRFEKAMDILERSPGRFKRCDHEKLST